VINPSETNQSNAKGVLIKQRTLCTTSQH